MPPNYYAVLGVAPYARIAEIQRAYDRIAEKYCSNSSYDRDVVRRARQACKALSDTNSRIDHDRAHWVSRVRHIHDVEEEKEITRTEAFDREEAIRWRREKREREIRRRVLERKRRAKAEVIVVVSEEELMEQELNKMFQDALNTQAHGLIVQTTVYPAKRQRCTYRSRYWTTHTAGTHVCAYCLAYVELCSSCPGCEIMACKACFRDVEVVERQMSFGEKGLSV